MMVKCVEGTFRDGKVELLEIPEDVRQARVIVAFLPSGVGEERGPDLTPQELAELRWRLSAWEEDWNAPGMEVYDDL